MWQLMSLDEVRRKLKANLKMGLTQSDVEERKTSYGKNELKDKKKESIIIKFIKQFNDFMIIILILAAIISAAVSYMQGENDYIDSMIIIAIVIFNAIMGLIQENKAEKSLEALKNMSAPTAKVRREGKEFVIPVAEVVPGDIVLLEAGNFVPADSRLIYTYDLKVEEASLTGETVPVLKDASVHYEKEVPIGDTLNMVYATTIITNGHAEAIVTDTGMNTKVGQIAKMILADESPETPLQKKLGEVGKKLGLGALGICFLIFVIGIFKKIPIFEMFMTSVGLAVAAIPEGLPAIVTIMLSIGVTKMAKKNAIIRKLPAVETLGSSTVICSDKTGTLTQNKMEVVQIADIEGIQPISQNESSRRILRLGSMCNDSKIIKDGRILLVDGEPTEAAIVNAGLEVGENKNDLYIQMKRLHEIPFDSTRKLMTTIHKLDHGYRIITKGAPDVLLKRCNRYLQNGKISNITETAKRKINTYNTQMAEQALRVLAVSYCDVEGIPNKIESDIIEQNLVFVGLIGMIDPPREGVKEAVSTCLRAGIKTVMITGDHVLTAKAIAKQLGILKPSDKAMTGEELDQISDTKLERDIMHYSVFARVSPEHKVRIVKAFRSNGQVVAMTGDGVNDAPALKNADIGVAMGKGGTDVAKNAADMVLTDDNFVTIVEAVKEGRHIFENIRKAIHFLISTNIGEIVTIFIGLLLGLEAPLVAIQLLWINLITDSLPAIALGLERPDKDIMKRKPRNSKKGLFADGLWSKMFVQGTMLGMLTLLAFSIGYKFYGLEVGRTMAFMALGLLELVHSFNIKTEESIFKSGVFENKYLVGAFILGLLLQLIVVMIPPVAEIFGVVPLTQTQWIYTIVISFAPIVIMEIQKKINEERLENVIYEYEKS